MVLRKCGLVNSWFYRNCNISSLKVKRVDEEVIDIGREFQILGPSQTKKETGIIVIVFSCTRQYLHVFFSKFWLTCWIVCICCDCLVFVLRLSGESRSICWTYRGLGFVHYLKLVILLQHDRAKHRNILTNHTIVFFILLIKVMERTNFLSRPAKRGRKKQIYL